MFPLGHLSLGYLSVALVRRLRGKRIPTGLVMLAALLGSQAPDIVDKPLAYYGFLVSGRSLAHSLLIVLPTLAALWTLTANTDYREYAEAFIIGMLSHYVGDTYRLVLSGEVGMAKFLFWPVFPATDYPADTVAPWVRITNAIGDPRYRIESLLAIVAVMVWVYAVVKKRWGSVGSVEERSG